MVYQRSAYPNLHPSREGGRRTGRATAAWIRFQFSPSREGGRSACDNILYPILTRSFIHDNGACQIGKGVDFAIERMKYWLRRVYRAQRRERARAAGCRVEDVGPFQADALIYKGDVRKYFPTSRFSVAKATLRKAVASDRLAAFFCAVVESFGEEWWEARLIAVGAPTPAAAKAARAITDARVERESLPLRPEGERDGILRERERQIAQAVRRTPGLSQEDRAAIMSNLELIFRLCELLDRAQQIIRRQASLLAEHGIETSDGEIERQRGALLREIERNI